MIGKRARRRREHIRALQVDAAEDLQQMKQLSADLQEALATIERRDEAIEEWRATTKEIANERDQAKVEAAAANRDLALLRNVDGMKFAVEMGDRAHRAEAALAKMAWMAEFYMGLSTFAARCVPEVRHAELKRMLDIMESVDGS